MIELVKFRIKNYRSITDSGDCYLANKITVLAGKNESGKSSILEALEDFDTEKEIRKNATPIHDESKKPEIIVTFKVSNNIINEIMEKLKFSKNFESDIEITIKKDFPKNYNLDEDSFGVFNIDKKIIAELFPKIKNAIKELASIRPFPIETLENLDVFKSQYESYYTPAKQEIGQITDESLRNRFSELLDMVKTDFKIYEEAISFEKRFLQAVPNLTSINPKNQNINKKISLPLIIFQKTNHSPNFT